MVVLVKGVYGFTWGHYYVITSNWTIEIMVFYHKPYFGPNH